MIRVLASLRSANLSEIEAELKRLEAAGIDGLHVDVMDGRFVEESSFEPGFITDLRSRTKSQIDVHLMANDPGLLAPAYAEAGSDRIAFHLEVVDDPTALADQIRKNGAQPGLVLLPGTPIEAVFDVAGAFELVNPLGVDPTRGLGFQASTFGRIEALAKFRESEGLEFAIQADGGVWEKTRDALVEAGADELVGGYPIFSVEDYAVAVQALRG